MSVTVVLVCVSVLAAALAVVASVVAIRALREVRALRETTATALRERPAPAPAPAPTVTTPVVREAPHRVVEGRVIVTPTQEQAVAAVMARPRYRAAVLVSGFAHALRPESRDRITAMMRREYRARRRQRLRVARAAARTHQPEARS